MNEATKKQIITAVKEVALEVVVMIAEKIAGSAKEIRNAQGKTT